MKRTLLSLALIAVTSFVSAAPWTYRGTLNDGGKPANGSYDFRLTLVNSTGSASISQPITLFNVPIKDGNFSAEVDFGFDLTTAPSMKLKTEVQQGDSGFASLDEPTAFDAKAALAGICWDTTGNSGINANNEFIGTTDLNDLVLRSGNVEVARLGAVSPSGGDVGSVIFGRQNTRRAGVGGATISGGGNVAIGNLVTDDFGVVGGGSQNVAGDDSPIGGIGFPDGARTASHATVGGGAGNQASGKYSSVVGGQNNCAGGDFSWAGGRRAQVRRSSLLSPSFTACSSVASTNTETGDQGTFIWADSQNTNFTSTGSNQFAIRAAGGLRWGGTGVNSTVSPAFTHQAIFGTNTCDTNTRTVINHPLLNGNPNAVILMTPNFGDQNTGTAPPRGATGVYYSNGAGGCTANRWVIYQLAVTPETLNNGVKFNMWFVLP